VDPALDPPRKPWLRRLPPAAWAALTCGAAAWYALALATTVPQFYGRGAGHLATWAVAGLAAALAVPVALTRRWPWTALGMLLAEALGLAALRAWPWVVFLAADALVCSIAARGSRRAGLSAAALTMAALAGDGVVQALTRDSFSMGLKALILPMSLVIAWMAGNSARQRREYHVALAAQAAARAVTAERLRIARDLHDMVAHSIGIIAIQAGAGSLVIDQQPAHARAALGVIEDTSRQTLAGLRRMLAGLRQPDSCAVQTGAAPGLADVGQLAARTGDAGVRVEVVWRGTRRPLPADIELSAFRIVQESVANVVRHAGTTHCRVGIEYTDDQLAIEVTDDGQGAPDRARPAAGTGYGIAGMRERAGLLHGQLSAGPRPGGGFRVAARLPVPGPAGASAG
jgi:signal transduction histidine kinase